MPSKREFEYDVESAIVTGATGTVGSWAVDRLADSGVSVVGLDRDRPTGTRANARFRALDLQNAAEAWETVAEVDPDAVVHCAASSEPSRTPGTRLFHNNVASTYNVLVAAGRHGAPVVWTSSQAAYGSLFSTHPWIPDYLPIDETHDCRPEDPYGTSKLCGEAIADMVARRYEIPVTTIRPATIFTPNHYRARPQEEDFDLGADPVAGSFGSYVDVRDVTRMIEAALAADQEGHEPYLCVADENYLGEPTAEIVEAICGTLPEECALEGKQAALSNERARQHLGWRPRHTWREEHSAPAAGPRWC